MDRPTSDNGFQADHAALLLHSYEKALGRPLLSCAGGPIATAETLYHAPFVVLSHDGAADPVFTYGNQRAQDLWEVSWEALTQMPSRLSAEPDERDARAKMLASLNAQGYLDDYTGIRISTTGRRFFIKQAVIWTLWDKDGRKVGQAASFSETAPV